MKFLTSMPTTPEIGNCEKHGDYEFLYSPSFSGKIWVRDSCGECIKKENEDKAKEELEREKERAAYAIEQKENT